MPVEEPTVATKVLLLLHVPPEVASVKVVEVLRHTPDAPPIVPADNASMVTTVVALALPHEFVAV